MIEWYGLGTSFLWFKFSVTKQSSVDFDDEKAIGSSIVTYKSILSNIILVNLKKLDFAFT